jgi:hypothetical protein
LDSKSQKRSRFLGEFCVLEGSNKNALQIHGAFFVIITRDLATAPLRDVGLGASGKSVQRYRAKFVMKRERLKQGMSTTQ